MAERAAEYEYVLVIPEHGMVGSGPTTDLRAVEQDYEAWHSETGRVGTIMRRLVADWEDMPSPLAMEPCGRCEDGCIPGTTTPCPHCHGYMVTPAAKATGDADA